MIGGVEDKAAHNSLILARNTAIIPSHKGFLSIQAGNNTMIALKSVPLALREYDTAYKYLRTYKSNQWLMPQMNYYHSGEYDKAIEISEEMGVYDVAVYASIMKGDYKKALEYARKSLEKKPSSVNMISYRALIYRNLGNTKSAQRDYNLALNLCVDDKCKTNVRNKYNNYRTYTRDEWNNVRQRQVQKGIDIIGAY